MDDVLPRPVPDARVAATGLRVSAVTGAVGLGFLIGMFAAFAAGARSTGMALGWINDVTGVVTLPLALPGMLALHARIRPRAGRSGDAVLALGVGSAGAISFLQLLLVTERLTFEEEIGPVSRRLPGARRLVHRERPDGLEGRRPPGRHAARRPRRDLRRLPGLGVPPRARPRGARRRSTRSSCPGIETPAGRRRAGRRQGCECSGGLSRRGSRSVGRR